MFFFIMECSANGLFVTFLSMARQGKGVFSEVGLVFSDKHPHSPLVRQMIESSKTSRRIVVAELLDDLPSSSPVAIRSRKDLQRINFLMGNFSWIINALKKSTAPINRIVEIGAGDGLLLNRLASDFPTATFTAYDLAPRPADLSDRVEWFQGDLFDSSLREHGGTLIANLFLHHFENPALQRLGEWCESFDALIFCEPDRARVPHLLGNLMHPFINHITRHDMHVSIDAGFSDGELAEALGLSSARWQIREFATWSGARRFMATRRSHPIKDPAQ